MKKVACAIMAVSMVASLGTTAFGADIATAGGTGSAEAVLTAEAITFTVTVPMQLPITVSADGTVTTSTDAKIVNGSAGAVVVSNVVFTPIEGWTAIDFTKDMSAVKVGTKEIGFSINECTTGADGILVFNQAKFPAIASKNDGTTDELALTYNATVAAQKDAITAQKVADVVFTIGWDELTID